MKPFTSSSSLESHIDDEHETKLSEIYPTLMSILSAVETVSAALPVPFLNPVVQAVKAFVETAKVSRLVTS